MIELMGRILRMPFPWNIWVVILGLVNIGGGLWFARHPAGMAALTATMLAFLVMAALYARLGFVRLLGFGHLVAWMPLVAYFGFLIAREPSEDLYGWLVTVVVLNLASLVIDTIDIARYALGERNPTD